MTDSFNLERFVESQRPIYPQILQELAAGEKRTHWMWFIFPQVQGLGRSATAVHYALNGLDEARAYLLHPILGPRLKECCRLLLQVEGKTAAQVFESPDDMKFRSCLTLFQKAEESEPLFGLLLKKFYRGRRDKATLTILGRSE
jgi:uncharacterized protein (DUF1810 family)